MPETKAKKMIYKQNDLIKELATRCNFYQGAVKKMFNALEAIVIEDLQEATEDYQIEIKLLGGITIIGMYIPAREMRDPRNGEKIQACARIKVYGQFSRSLHERVNGYGYTKKNIPIKEKKRKKK